MLVVQKSSYGRVWVFYQWWSHSLTEFATSNILSNDIWVYLYFIYYRIILVKISANRSFKYVLLREMLMWVSKHSCYIHFTGQQPGQCESSELLIIRLTADGMVVMVEMMVIMVDPLLFWKYMKIHIFFLELKHGYILQSANTWCVVHLFSHTTEIQYTETAKQTKKTCNQSKNGWLKDNQLYWIDRLKKYWKHMYTHVDHNKS